jgi:hypothetical protein
MTGCTTNKYDAEIAKARFEYGKVVNAPKKLFEIKGEIRCTDEQINTNNCGLVVFDVKQRYVNVEPPQSDKYAVTLDFLGKLASPFFQFQIAKNNNEHGTLRQLSSDSMFKDIFNGMAEIKGSGVTTTNTYTDSNNDMSQHSSIQDSNNSSDTYSYDSYNTTSGDTANESYNSSSSSENTSSNSETNTQGDTTTTTTEVTNEAVNGDNGDNVPQT